MVRQRRGSKKRGGKAAIFADVSREPYYLLSFALDVSFVAFLAHPSSNPFASKIPRKNSSYIAELSGTGQKKNRTMRDVRKRMLKVQGFKLASHRVSCQLLYHRVKLSSTSLQFHENHEIFKLIALELLNEIGSTFNLVFRSFSRRRSFSRS